MEWEDVPYTEIGHRGSEQSSVAVPETGFGALVAWCAGPSFVTRSRKSSPSDQRVTLVHSDRSGATVRTSRPFTPEDQFLVDEAIDEYLREADVPARPRGYDWWIHVPTGETDVQEDAFWSQLNLAILDEEPLSNSPRDVLTVIDAVLPALLRSGSTH